MKERSRSRRRELPHPRQEEERDTHRDSVSPGKTPICRNFNCGRCDRLSHDSKKAGRRCKWAHLCWTCRKPDCPGAHKCKNKDAKREKGKGHRREKGE